MTTWSTGLLSWLLLRSLASSHLTMLSVLEQLQTKLGLKGNRCWKFPSTHWKTKWVISGLTTHLRCRNLLKRNHARQRVQLSLKLQFVCQKEAAVNVKVSELSEALTWYLKRSASRVNANTTSCASEADSFSLYMSWAKLKTFNQAGFALLCHKSQNLANSDYYW